MHVSNLKQDDVSRRKVLGVLAAAGITGTVTSNSAAQPAPKLSIDVLRNAAIIRGEHFSEERLKIIEAALQNNLNEFQRVRNFKVDDLTEPAPAFDSRRQDLPRALAESTGASDESTGTGAR